MAIGRPTKYTKKLAYEICERVMLGESNNQILQDPTMPAPTTFYRWIDENKEFRDMYTKAKEDQQETYIDQLVDIADNGCQTPVLIDGNPLMIDGKPLMTVTPAGVSHAKLRIETRKWTAVKLKPRKYGDKKELTIDLPDGAGVLMTPPVLSTEDWLKLSQQANKELIEKQKAFKEEHE